MLEWCLLGRGYGKYRIGWVYGLGFELGATDEWGMFEFKAQRESELN